MYQALYRKWRPRSFDDVVGQGHITETLKRQIAQGRLSHAYLFTGTRGTGKTSCAKLLARAVNCTNPQNGNPCNECPACVGIEKGSVLDVLELDAASNNRVDDIRAILEEAVYTPATVARRVYIIDEVHMLSPQAFNALLQILEEPPAHLMFILATTELHKVPATIKSRCQQFAFKRLQPQDIAQRLTYVAGQEGIALTQEGAALIARLADGGMRDALSLLDQCAGVGGEISQEQVFRVLGLAGNLETAAMLEDIAQGDIPGVLERLARLYAAGKEMAALAGELSALIRDLMVSKSAPNGGAGLMTGGYDSATLARLGKCFQTPRLVQMLSAIQATAADLARSANRRTDMELCLVTLCDPTLDGSAAGLSARVARLEDQLSHGVVPAAAPQSRPQPVAKPQTSPAQEDAPPWETTTPSPREEKPAPVRPPVTVQAPATPVTVPQPSSPSVPAGTSGGWPGWEGVCARLKGVLSTGDYTFFSMPGMIAGRWDGQRVTLWAANQFVADLAEKPDISGAVAQTIAQVMGKRVPVSVQVGTAPPEQTAPQPAAPPVSEGEVDALDAFLSAGQDNVIVEG